MITSRFRITFRQTRKILALTSGRTCYEEGPARSVGGVLITGYTLDGCLPARKE